MKEVSLLTIAKKFYGRIIIESDGKHREPIRDEHGGCRRGFLIANYSRKIL